MAVTTVLIPAYNEQDHVGALIKTVLEVDFPAIVADEGLADATAKVAEAAGAEVVRLPQNQDKGGAVAYGLRHAETPLVMLLDADLTGLTPGTGLQGRPDRALLRRQRLRKHHARGKRGQRSRRPQPHRATVCQIVRHIADAGFTPAERDPYYNILRYPDVEAALSELDPEPLPMA